MDSVALDVFYMDPAKHQGQEFDCMVLCVDRESGRIVPSPQRPKGMTARKVAPDMIEKAWDPLDSHESSPAKKVPNSPELGG